MHHAAEYGRASHWQYKASMQAAAGSKASTDTATEDEAVPSYKLPPTASPLPTPSDFHDRVRPGQPALCVSHGKCLDAVVVCVDEKAPEVVVAMTWHARWPGAGAGNISEPMHAAEYHAMFAHATRKGWTISGLHDDKLQMRTFRAIGKGVHVHVDHMDRASRDITLTFVDPLPDIESESESECDTDVTSDAAEASGESDVSTSGEEGGWVNRWRAYQSQAAAAPIDSETVVRLRAQLEWGSEAAAAQSASEEDVAAAVEAELTLDKRELYNSTNAQELVEFVRSGAKPPDEWICIIMEPGGLLSVPRGTTAHDIVQKYGMIELSVAPGTPPPRLGQRLVNVNNELMPESTELKAGDLVVLSNHVLADV